MRLAAQPVAAVCKAWWWGSHRESLVLARCAYAMPSAVLDTSDGFSKATEVPCREYLHSMRFLCDLSWRRCAHYCLTQSCASRATEHANRITLMSAHVMLASRLLQCILILRHFLGTSCVCENPLSQLPQPTASRCKSSDLAAGCNEFAAIRNPGPVAHPALLLCRPLHPDPLVTHLHLLHCWCQEWH